MLRVELQPAVSSPGICFSPEVRVLRPNSGPRGGYLSTSSESLLPRFPQAPRLLFSADQCSGARRPKGSLRSVDRFEITVCLAVSATGHRQVAVRRSTLRGDTNRPSVDVLCCCIPTRLGTQLLCANRFRAQIVQDELILVRCNPSPIQS
jgi:hypothetical protein